ncbi:cell wall-associated NlpC family hydrolase [Streptomyces sp. SLBN-118]|uniref:C40 family peptidase n=1 Tax=Streptomyces sp. SLBN-118 TaxID=2768454 RepID=UPI00114EAA84|nr:C40 family peptidase [Streptomyces sp. SLBN-118]TQK43977.1 cell wall-associated NlpC family hydrolase [Streptomyces sp. SLBN-118]
MASHRRPSQPGLTHTGRVSVLSAAAATAAAALGAAPASADPQDTTETTRTRVDRLYEEAEQATEEFNKAGERVERLRKQVTRAQDRVARGQERINRMRGALGSVAGAQYRSGGMDPALALLLSEDPDSYLDKAATLDRIGELQASALHDLRLAQRRLGQERAETSRDLAELEHSRVAVARHKRTVERKLTEAQRLLNSLPSEYRAGYDRASRSGRDAMPELSGLAPASARAAAAARAARSAVGRPYVWGANGPSGFDCSGLTQWSYAQAGVALPRTSQAQRYAGRQVPLSEARPGDLVAYRSDASHIAMYMGNGQVIHAPYPGAPVRYDPVGMMPISSVTRV